MNRTHPTLPVISVVTPSFNQGEFLEECIDSVLSQNYPNLEYVIMDGGSSDNSVEIIRKYEKYLSYWQSAPDNGQYGAIADGFRKTSGDIMCWLNSDDKFHHQAFFKVAYLFGEHPEAEWLTGRTNVWDKGGGIELIIYDFLPLHSRKKYLNLDYNNPSIQQESTFWKRSLWERAGGDLRTDLRFAGDLELWARFFRHGAVHSVDSLLGGFRKHGNQKTAHHLGKYDAEARAVLEEEQRFYREQGAPPLPAPPPPLVIDPVKFRCFVDGALLSSGAAPVYSLAGNGDAAIQFLVRQLQRVAATTYGTQRYLEHLEISGASRAEKISGLIRELEREVGSAAGPESLRHTVTEIAEQWSRAQEEWDESVTLATDLRARLEILSKPEEQLKGVLVAILDKIGLYSFYVRHQLTFSRVYFAVRDLFVRRP